MILFKTIQLRANATNVQQSNQKFACIECLDSEEKKPTSKRWMLTQFVINFVKSAGVSATVERSRVINSLQIGKHVGKHIGTVSQNPERVRIFLTLLNED